MSVSCSVSKPEKTGSWMTISPIRPISESVMSLSAAETMTMV
jgi:hypothetical protein